MLARYAKIALVTIIALQALIYAIQNIFNLSAVFQMWQTEMGANSLTGAFQYPVLSGIVLLYLSIPEPEVWKRCSYQPTLEGTYRFRFL